MTRYPKSHDIKAYVRYLQVVVDDNAYVGSSQVAFWEVAHDGGVHIGICECALRGNFLAYQMSTLTGPFRLVKQ